MRRRRFLSLAAVAACASAARAQQSDRIRHIGLLVAAPAGDAEIQRRLAALREGLRRLGWVEGRNLRIEAIWASADRERIRALAAELVRTG